MTEIKTSLPDPQVFDELITHNPENTQLRKPERPQELMLQSEKGLRRLELLSEQSFYVLGRFPQNNTYTHYIDLSPFDGQALGVSRVHAQILLEGGRMFITDLDSRNGTYVGGQRLEPQQRRMISSDDVIILGRLHLKLALSKRN